MAGFGRVVDGVIEKSDIILEILDARFIDETRNAGIERRIKKRNKILIHVINKCDYADKKYLEDAKKRLENCVFVSATQHFGISMLKQKILTLAGRRKIKYPVVGVIGYPNVGKSSLINSLKGSGSAKTSPEPGYTKGKQYLRVGRDFLMVDTPGVISKGMDEEDELVLLGAKNPDKIADPELALIKLLNRHTGMVEKKYGVEIKEDKEETIEDIALKLNLKKKKGLPDTLMASRKILHDWIKGKIL